ncbi:MAG: anthranilate synthase component I [Lentisphaerae bacterium]|nr:MAG: anthranilate synthase component I [Lentisphaerota bacterium]
MLIDFDRFKEIHQSGCNVIPLVRVILADMETPIRIVRRFKEKGEPFFLLESVEGGETWGRYSILGTHIRKRFVIRGGKGSLIHEDGQTQMFEGNPVEALQSYLKRFRLYEADDLPAFSGGAVGYFSFEAVQYFERCGDVKPDDEEPFYDGEFFFPEGLIVFDNCRHQVLLIAPVVIGEDDDLKAVYDRGVAELDALERLLLSGVSEGTLARRTYGSRTVAMASNMEPEAYREMVRRCRQYIIDGDIIQVVVAQHFSTHEKLDPMDVYRALRYVNPSPYMYYLDFADGRAIAGSSPEVMVRVEGGRALIRPIAGTRPRSGDADEDAQRAEDLLADPKERAEHVMLVDLARNDLGRIARIGSVEVTDYMVIERYSHVMHLVSQVEADLREDVDAMDVFMATFPAGTLSGAPKVRAMEIINELEPQRRGPYGGALGYIGYGNRVMDLAITIRTVVMDGERTSVTAGAGIVYDSDPQKEFEETCHKARGMCKALELAANGLDLESK